MSAMKKPYILASLVSLLHKLGFGVLTVFAYLLLTSSPFKGYPSKEDNFCCDLTIVEHVEAIN